MCVSQLLCQGLWISAAPPGCGRKRQTASGLSCWHLSAALLGLWSTGGVETEENARFAGSGHRNGRPKTEKEKKGPKAVRNGAFQKWKAVTGASAVHGPRVVKDQVPLSQRHLPVRHAEGLVSDGLGGCLCAFSVQLGQRKENLACGHACNRAKPQIWRSRHFYRKFQHQGSGSAFTSAASCLRSNSHTLARPRRLGSQTACRRCANLAVQSTSPRAGPVCNYLPSFRQTWHLTRGPSKRKLIFQVPSHRCHVSGRKGIILLLSRIFFGNSPGKFP